MSRERRKCCNAFRGEDHLPGCQFSKKRRMPLVIIESPLAGDVEANVAFARECLLDTVRRGEAGLASHLLWPQVLDDKNPEQRNQGIEAGLAWGRVADYTVVYTDRGISPGMQKGIDRAKAEGRRVEYRQLRPPNPVPFHERAEK